MRQQQTNKPERKDMKPIYVCPLTFRVSFATTKYEPERLLAGVTILPS